MSRFVTAFGWEMRIQWRQGIHYAALVMVLIWVVALVRMPEDLRALLLPFGLFMDVSIFGLYFMAAALFLEKGEGVLEALVVTPAPRGLYLVSKLSSLTLVAVVASVVLALVFFGAQVNWFYLVAGTALNAWFLTLVGFILAARYNSITDFLVPSLYFMAPSQIPLLWYFGIWSHWLVYLLPTQPAMLLIAAAFRSSQAVPRVAGWEIVYSFVYLLTACLAVTWLALRAYDQFVVRKQGRR